jgi:hypothetical protein
MTYIQQIPPLNSAFGEALVAHLDDKIHVQFAYIIHAEQASTAVVSTGTATNGTGEVTIGTGTGAAGAATLRTIRTLRYLTGKGGDVRFAGRFTTGVADSRQEAGYGDDDDGFFFGYSGATFGVWRRKGAVDTFVAQTAWNVDKMDGTGPSGQTLDPTKSCVYKITFQWLGAGAIQFYVEAAGGSSFTLVHTMFYAGLYTTTSVSNPTLPIRLKVINTGNTTNLTMSFASLAGFLQGVDRDFGLARSTDQAATSITTEVAVMTLRNRATFNSVTNRVPMQITGFGAGVYDNQASTLAMVRLKKNVTLGGTPSYADINTSISVAEKDVAGTTVTGGIRKASIPFSPNDSHYMVLTDNDIWVFPGETITISVESTGTLNNIWIGLDWKELF